MTFTSHSHHIRITFASHSHHIRITFTSHSHHICITFASHTHYIPSRPLRAPTDRSTEPSRRCQMHNCTCAVQYASIDQSFKIEFLTSSWFDNTPQWSADPFKVRPFFFTQCTYARHSVPNSGCNWVKPVRIGNRMVFINSGDVLCES